MKNLIKAMVAAVALGFGVSALAVPTLQIGAPGGPGEGAYADYVASLANPTESDTALTSGTTLYAAGVFGKDVTALGAGTWSDINTAYAVFDGIGAILLAAVPDGQLAAALGSLKVNGASAVHSSATLSGLFPNNHDPLKDNVSDFLFFNIGPFSNNANAVPDFASETGAADGEIKTLTLTGIGALDWIHFDLLALETKQTVTGPKKNPVTTFGFTIQNNPGSHDVTWKPGGGPPPGELPEPGSLALLGLALAGLGAMRRRFV